MTKTVCVIGLGTMGYGAAQSLLRAGFTVRGVDVRPEVRQRFASEGGVAALTPAEGAKDAEAVFVFVVNSEQTEAVLFGNDGAVSVMPKGAVLATCATVPPAFVEGLAERLKPSGVLLLDAPVSGGGAKAASGEMTVMGAGSPAAFSKAEPFLKAIATKVYNLGDAPGQGSRVKMINQLLAGVHIAVSAEAMALGMRAGIDPNVLYEVISNSAGSSWMFQNRVPHILKGDYTPLSAVDIFVKDLGIVTSTGDALGIELPIASTALKLFDTASGRGLGREDDSAVIKVYAEDSGIALPTGQGS
ncbi:MAG: 3-hydroxyisobutyrate dehydrogenase [Hyphomicrobiales bacterium]|nr:3-hydroxyisobutyrate dehydrogenase [Hyphomicrobiales bacterium]